jgi:uncharacterized protein
MMHMIDVPSPCVNVCKINTRTGYCIGCHRTITEIARWPEYSIREKRKVLQLIERRARQGTARSIR